MRMCVQSHLQDLLLEVSLLLAWGHSELQVDAVDAGVRCACCLRGGTAGSAPGTPERPAHGILSAV